MKWLILALMLLPCAALAGGGAVLEDDYEQSQEELDAYEDAWNDYDEGEGETAARSVEVVPGPDGSSLIIITDDDEGFSGAEWGGILAGLAALVAALKGAQVVRAKP